MNCKNINKHFLDYLDKHLSSVEKEKIESHLAQCPECSNKLEQFKKLYKLFSKTKEIHTSQAFKSEFAQILENEKSKISIHHFRLNSIKNSLKVAASILIFIAGTVFGVIIQNYNLNTSKISNLESQISILKQQVAYEMLSGQKSASEKLTAINLASEESNLNKDIASALYNVLISDENSSVRIEAAITLQQFSNDDSIKTMLINSLKYQNDPLVQIKLIQILSSFKKSNSEDAIKLFFKQEELLPIVREYGKKML